mmetsp:Transcript_28734/g.42225  ORF Transcript_28734/g.42225 Transcript_28734/m.42225 type:complete len:125 (-) Transcript_28734:657-1031(-)
MFTAFDCGMSNGATVEAFPKCPLCRESISGSHRIPLLDIVVSKLIERQTQPNETCCDHWLRGVGAGESKQCHFVTEEWRADSAITAFFAWVKNYLLCFPIWPIFAAAAFFLIVMCCCRERSVSE